MNRKTLATLLVAAAAAGSAFAESPTVVKDDFVSAKSRAEVQAELLAYQKAGVNPWSIRYNPLAHFRGTASRADVTAAYIAERDAVAAIGSEDSGAAYFAQLPRAPRSETLAGQPVNAR
jgi:hypothetical protein